LTADRFVSFHRISFGAIGSEAIPKSWRAKTYSRPLASKSGGAFAFPALQLVPPLITAQTHTCTDLFKNMSI